MELAIGFTLPRALHVLAQLKIAAALAEPGSLSGGNRHKRRGAWQ